MERPFTEIKDDTGREGAMSRRVLDLGCGRFPHQAKQGETVVTIDHRAEVNATITHDLSERPWPVKENSVDIVNCSHILEHMSDQIGLFEEIYRVLKPNGKVIIRVPHFSSQAAWRDPTHVRAYSYKQFYYFGDDSPRNNCDRYGTCKFRVETVRLRYQPFAPKGLRLLDKVISWLANLNPSFCERFWCYYVGGLSEIQVTLITVK